VFDEAARQLPWHHRCAGRRPSAFLCTSAPSKPSRNFAGSSLNYSPSSAEGSSLRISGTGNLAFVTSFPNHPAVASTRISSLLLSFLSVIWRVHPERTGTVSQSPSQFCHSEYKRSMP
jgi:hypothetical protein